MPGTPKAHQPFIEQYEWMARRLAEKTSFNHYRLSYRSGFPPPQKWLGPDILDVIKSCQNDGRKGIVVAELLSVIANAEVIQEVGLDAKNLAHTLQLEFVQTEYLNDSDDFIYVLTNHILADMNKRASLIK